MNKVVIVLFTLLACSSAQAEVFNTNKLYLGGGLASNSLQNFDDAIGYQIFSGYELDIEQIPFLNAVELGYTESGEFEFDLNLPGSPTSISGSVESAGIWAAAVLDYNIDDSFGILGRLGYDFGDDDGLLFGLGLEYKMSPSISLRGEYVQRDEIESLQINLVYHLGK